MKPSVVSFHYTLKDKSGKLIESSQGQDPIAYLEGSGMIIPGLEKELITLNKGDKKVVNVKAKEAYGEHDKNLMLDVPNGQLPKDATQIKVGDQFTSQSPDGHAQVFTVTKVNTDSVTLDGNHPLAGQDLTFDVEVIERREATEEEMSHGHVHGAGGHDH